jgi:uncharacterized protein YcbK (DUF882 family)
MKYYKPDHFTTQELVPQHIYKRDGDSALLLFDARILWTIDQIRKYYKKPVYVNNWDAGGNEEQRGFRTKINKKTPKSQHYFGRAIDFDIKGITAEKFRKDVKSGKLVDIMIYVTGIEDCVSWNHIDCGNRAGKDIVFFKA